LIGKPLAFADLLSDEQIAQALQSNPEAIYEMVRKLYIVENAIPTIHIPTQRVILKENGDLVVEYTSSGSIEIGQDPYQLSYTFELKPKVEAGFKQRYLERRPVHPVWYVLGSVVIFSSGVVTGVLLMRS